MPETAIVARHASVDPELTGLLARVERRWIDLGHGRPLHRSPLEHVTALPGDALPPQLSGASREVVDAYYRVRYGGRAADAAQLVRLNEFVYRVLFD